MRRILLALVEAWLVLQADATGTVDLVLVIGHVGGQRAGQPQIEVLVMDTDLAVQAGLGNQLRVTDDHPTHGSGTEVGRTGAQVRSLVARRYPTLQGEVVIHVPYGIHLGTELAAELLVVIQPTTQGQDQVVGDAPVVLQEDRVLVAVHLHQSVGVGYNRLTQTVAAVLQILVLVGQTTGQGMRTEEPAGLGVGSDHLELDTVTGIGVQGCLVFRVIIVDVGIGEDAAVLSLVGQEVVGFHRIAVGRIICLWNTAARVLPALLLSIAVAQGEEVLLVQIPGQLGPGVTLLVLGIGGCTVIATHEVALILTVITTGQLQAQHILDQRHVQEGAGLETIFVDIVTAASHGVLGGNAAGQFLADFLGDDVDHTAHGI